MISPVVRIPLSEENIIDDYENTDLFVTSDALTQEELLEATNRVLAHLKLASRVEPDAGIFGIASVIQHLEEKEIYPVKIPATDWSV